MQKQRQAGGEGTQRTPARHQVKLPGFISDKTVGADAVGLGDVIKRATTIAGIRPCGGCGARAARLNQWVSFSPRR